jgi:hypothetical protein
VELNWLAIEADHISAIASTLQAVAVVPAILIAAFTLRRDSRDRRMDRLLAFHQELVSGDLNDARQRLAAHLRRHGTPSEPVRVTSRRELRDDRRLRAYQGDKEHNPYDDVNLLLRFFERVNAARLANALYRPMLVELVGRHAAWWDLAIAREDQPSPQWHMHSLAAWANIYAAAYRRKHPYLRDWGHNRSQDFPPEVLASESPTASAQPSKRMGAKARLTGIWRRMR